MSNHDGSIQSLIDAWGELVRLALPPACPVCEYVATNCKCHKADAIASPSATDAQTLPNCPVCDNAYLAIRTDVYKDKREFVYCDCCGATATRQLWVLASIGKESNKKIGNQHV